MKAIFGLAVMATVVCVACGALPPLVAEISESLLVLQGFMHVAVVETFSPLYQAFSLLHSEYEHFSAEVEEHQVPIQKVVVPEFDVTDVFTCQPDYSTVLDFMAWNGSELVTHRRNATLLAHCLDFISLLLHNNVVDDETMDLVSYKLNHFLSSYGSVLSHFKAAVCSSDTEL
ncbi:sperm-activating peptides-like [Diadema setosum]|uniref:sperm-activating peptides-like n=1 Tax=Diadema setosum TaxID=31175 RepID=UPI003B3AC3E1